MEFIVEPQNVTRIECSSDCGFDCSSMCGCDDFCGTDW